MSEQPTVGSLAEELRALAEVLADRSGGADGLLQTITESLHLDVTDDDEPAVQRIDIS